MLASFLLCYINMCFHNSASCKKHLLYNVAFSLLSMYISKLGQTKVETTSYITVISNYITDK